jgi:hypothetical protein
MMNTNEQALAAMELAWPHFIIEARKVLGSELHYQALLYYHLRSHGQVPLDQIGMNVKMWIEECVTPLFQKYAQRKAVGYQRGFEPIPDIVLFKPDVNGDWRRRNYKQTLEHSLAAIEVKASERYRDRLTYIEISTDIQKLCAQRSEMQFKGQSLTPIIVVVDTAPEMRERMRPGPLDAVCIEAENNGVYLYYVSQDTDRIIRPGSA